MKPLTHEELKKLVCYTDSDGTDYFYSKIQGITNTTLNYNGETFTIPSNEILLAIKQGMIDYEIYKLSMSNSDAEDVITNKAEEIIEKQFTTRFETMASIFSAMIESVENTLIASASKANGAAGALNNTREEMETLASSIKLMQTTLNPSAINSRVNKKLDELTEVKDEVLKAAKPVTTKVSSLITKLEKLVSIED